jgi:hypothetical protein
MSLSVSLTLTAQLRMIAARGDFYTFIHRGDPDSGLIILKWRMRQTLSLYTQERDFDDGTLKWRKQSDLLDESSIDAYITRATTRDPDVWVVEIETREDIFPLDGTVI